MPSLRAGAVFGALLIGPCAAGAQGPRSPKQYTIEQFMATTSVGGASFSPDESKVLFSSDATGIFNLYTVPVTGGKPVALTASSKDSTYAVAFFPADERVLFTRDQGGNELNHLYVRGVDGQERDLTPGEKLKAQFRGFTRSGDAFWVLTNERDPRFFDLYRYDAKTYARTLHYQDETGYLFGDVTDDGAWIALDKVQTTADSDVFLYNTASRAMKHLTPHPGQVANGVEGFDPDGQALYYLTNEGGEFARVKRYLLATGSHEEVEKADWDVAYTTFSKHGRYRVTAINEDGRTVIRLHDLKDGKLVALPSLPAADITSVVVSPSEKRLAFYVNGDRSPSNLYVYTLGASAPQRLTDTLNKEIDAEDLVDSEVVRFRARDGMTVPNILWKSVQATPASKAPALVWVHGGPGGQTRKGYSALIQYLVNHGYVVLGINNRGSSGYGQTFFTADDQKHGREPLWDCVDAKAYLSSLPFVDPDKIGIIGGSYGGYMVLAALTFQPEVFGVGVDIFGVSNWVRTLEGIPSWWEARRVALYKEMGDPVAQKDMLREISPVFHADRIRRPLMVLQGANDPRVVQPESDDIVAAVRKSGVPVEYVVFPDEGHGFSKRPNQIKGYGAIREFLDRYLKGASLPSLARQDEKDPGEALREAAGAGDVAGVRSLLEAGVPIDAGARHGQTALYFAADKGRLEVVRLLVERGADVNRRDLFFGSAPLTMALRGRHREVALYLLAHGAAGADEVLDAGVEGGDRDLVRAALGSGRLEPLDLLAARKAAEARATRGEKGADDVVTLLRAASVPKPKRAAYAPDPQRAKAYPGRYRGPGGEARVEVLADALRLLLPGQAELQLRAVAEDRYEDAEGDVAVTFGGRAGMVEALTLNRSGDVSSWGVVTADPVPLRVAGATAVPAGTPVSRTPGRPWPQFRGERAAGNGDGQGAPSEWSVKDGRNVRFKTPLPGLSLSSPILWGDRIFVVTAVSAKGDTTIRTGLYGDGDSVDDTSEHSFRLLALDKGTGRILWEREVFKGAPTVRRHLKSSLANATPATDGQRVVVLFGTVGVLAAYDFEGRQQWRQDVGILDCNDPQSGTAEWGHASSPVIWGDLVLVQGDRRRDSFLAAYRLVDGRPAWRVARDEASTWATPNLVRGPEGDELVTNGRTIRAYDPRDGKLLWTLGPNSEVVVSTPQVSEGMVYVTAGYPPVRPVYAVRAGHRGDLTLPEGARSSGAVAWSHARGGTYIPSPLLYRGYLYTLNNNGILTCYRAETGEQAYQTRLGSGASSFAASPVAADGRLYVASETGEVYVLRAGPEQELLVTNSMDEITMSTPAISDGLMVVRTAGHLLGLEGAPRAASR